MALDVQKIQCTVRLNLEGNTNLMTVVKAGPNALYAFEIPILRLMNDLDEGDELCCIGEAQMIGAEEMTNDDIRAVLSKYKQQLVQIIYPGNRGYARTLIDCELPDSALAKDQAPQQVKKAG